MFGSVVWRPYYKNSIKRLECIQHKVLRYLSYKNGYPMNRFDHVYSNQAIRYNLPTINSSMISADHIFIHKIMVNEINSAEISNLVPRNNLNYSLRSNQPFYIYPYHHNYMRTNPITRMCCVSNDYYKKAESPIGFNLKSNRVAITLKQFHIKY